MRTTAAMLVLVTIAALGHRLSVGWPKLIAALILVILFIPIRRYALPGNLPFEIEPYRVFVALIALVWAAALLVDRRCPAPPDRVRGPAPGDRRGGVRFDRGKSGPSGGCVVDRREKADVLPQLRRCVVRDRERHSTAGRLDFLVKVIVAGGVVVAMFSMVEARTGINVFNHSSASSRCWSQDRASSPAASRSSEPRGSVSSGRQNIRLRLAPRSSSSHRWLFISRGATGSAAGSCVLSHLSPDAQRPSRGPGS